jgi:hypothetical protein
MLPRDGSRTPMDCSPAVDADGARRRLSACAPSIDYSSGRATPRLIFLNAFAPHFLLAGATIVSTARTAKLLMTSRPAFTRAVFSRLP